MKLQETSKGKPKVESFFDPNTNTISHVVIDESTKKVAVIDSVLDYEQAAAKITYESADRIIKFIKKTIMNLNG